MLYHCYPGGTDLLLNSSIYHYLQSVLTFFTWGFPFDQVMKFNKAGVECLLIIIIIHFDRNNKCIQQASWAQPLFNNEYTNACCIERDGFECIMTANNPLAFTHGHDVVFQKKCVVSHSTRCVNMVFKRKQDDNAPNLAGSLDCEQNDKHHFLKKGKEMS